MKREAMGHRKLKKLCFRLQLPTYAGVGILESLWHLTSREAPTGDIGKMSDDDIAFAIDYRDDAATLVAALLYAGLVDHNPEHRLVVHDWPDHCEDSIHAKLARAGLRFANGQIPNFKKLSKYEREEAEKAFGRKPPAADGGQEQDSAANGGQIDETAADGGRRLPNEANGGLPCPAIPRHSPPSPALPSSEQLFVPDPEERTADEQPPARPLESRSGFTPAAEVLQNPSPPPTNGALRHTREAVAGYFPEPDDGVLGKILQAAQAVDLAITDEECGIWVHAVVPDSGIKRAKGPGWWTTTIPEELRKRKQDVRLLRAFVNGELPANEAQEIVHTGKADWRLLKALRVWMAQAAQVASA